MSSDVALPVWLIVFISVTVVTTIVLTVRSFLSKYWNRTIDKADDIVQARRNDYAGLAAELGFHVETSETFRETLAKERARRYAQCPLPCVTIWHRIKGPLVSNECSVYESMEFAPSGYLISTKTHILLATNQVFGHILLTPIGLPPAVASNVELDHEFGKHFTAVCDEEKFMRGVIDGGVLDLMLEEPRWRVAIFDNKIKIDQGRELSIDEIRDGLDFLKRLHLLLSDQAEEKVF